MNNYAVDRMHWATLSFLAQMANISAEVGRSIHAERKGQHTRSIRAQERALDLLAATCEQLAEKKSYRLKEVLRARNEYLRLFYGGTFETEAEQIEKYFNHFAMAYSRSITTKH